MSLQVGGQSNHLAATIAYNLTLMGRLQCAIRIAGRWVEPQMRTSACLTWYRNTIAGTGLVSALRAREFGGKIDVPLRVQAKSCETAVSDWTGAGACRTKIAGVYKKRSIGYQFFHALGAHRHARKCGETAVAILIRNVDPPARPSLPPNNRASLLNRLVAVKHPLAREQRLSVLSSYTQEPSREISDGSTQYRPRAPAQPYFERRSYIRANLYIDSEMRDLTW
jgi:hypothetical protein